MRTPSPSPRINGWTDQHIATLIESYAQGLTWSTIASRLRRSRGAVQVKFHDLKRAGYTPALAAINHRRSGRKPDN